eukprot:1435734-Amphidinium_carterae.2
MQTQAHALTRTFQIRCVLSIEARRVFAKVSVILSSVNTLTNHIRAPQHREGLVEQGDACDVCPSFCSARIFVTRACTVPIGVDAVQ